MDQQGQDQNVLFKQQKLQSLQQKAAALTAAPNSFQTPPSSQPVTSASQKPHRGPGSLIRLLLGIVAVIVITILVIMFLPHSGLQSGKVKLVWWGLFEDPAVVQPIIADFERQNPNITIEYSKQDPKQYLDRLNTRTNLGTGPDIFRFHNTWYPMLSDKLLPLSSDVISQDEFKKAYYPVMQTDLIHNGGIYGIPLGADSLSLFVNTDLLTAAGVQVPTTWEDFVAAAKKLTVKDENGTIKTAGAALGTYNNITHASDIVSLLFIQQGVDLSNLTASAQDETDAIDFYTSFAKGDSSTWNKDLDSSILSFSQGKLAMYFGYSWDIFTIQHLNKDLQFKVYPVPSLFDRKATIASYWVEGVSAKSQHQREALLFMHYLAQKDTAQKFYTAASKTRSFGEPYARTDLADSLKDNARLYPFVSQLKNAKSIVFSSDTGDGNSGLNSMSNSYLGNAINGIINDDSSTTSVVGTLNQGIAQAFAKYGIQ